ARLRAELARVGITDFQLHNGVARFGPLPLKESQKVRLDRLAPRSTVKERDDGRGVDLVVPLARPAKGGLRPGRDRERQDAIDQLERARTLLAELVPPATPSIGSAAS
ncbi:MAG TPA: hypothetical protein VM618_08990, partial [Acidimicrobiia bacterium]|nr:hypothetical protein [Acidimicrobiia bacterium]